MGINVDTDVGELAPDQDKDQDWGTDVDSVDLKALVQAVGTTWAAEAYDGEEMTWADHVASQEKALIQLSSGNFVLPQGGQHHRTQSCRPIHGSIHGHSLRGNYHSSTPDGCHEVQPSFRVPALQHKAEVAPVFLAYNKISSEGERISLMQIAMSVYQALSNSMVVDAIQPM